MQMLSLKHLHLFFHEEKPTVRYRSEFVENARSLKIRSFRHFIYVKLRTAVEVCQNLTFTPKYA